MKFGSLAAVEEQTLSNIDQKEWGLEEDEWRSIEELLRSLIFKDSFAYVFFGSKPMAFETITKSISLNVPFENGFYTLAKKNKGFDCFKRLATRLSKGKFLVISYELDEDQVLIVMNRENCLRVFEENKNIFESVLGKEITCEELLRKWCEGEPFMEVIREDEKLLGILLGYGSQNAELFVKRKEIMKKLKQFQLSEKNEKRMRTELYKLQKRLKFFNDFEPVSILDRCPLRLPEFIADRTSEETKKLQEIYRFDRKKIRQLLLNEPLAKFVLKTLGMDGLEENPRG